VVKVNVKERILTVLFLCLAGFPTVAFEEVRSLLDLARSRLSKLIKG